MNALRSRGQREAQAGPKVVNATVCPAMSIEVVCERVSVFHTILTYQNNNIWVTFIARTTPVVHTSTAVNSFQNIKEGIQKKNSIWPEISDEVVRDRASRFCTVLTCKNNTN